MTMNVLIFTITVKTLTELKWAIRRVSY